MAKIGLLVCGNSGIDYIDHKYDIEVIRSILFVGEKEYFDYVDITAPETIYVKVDKLRLYAVVAVFISYSADRACKFYETHTMATH